MVTAIDSTEKLDMLRAIGANHVVDCTREDFTQGSETYDVILDLVGKHPLSRCVQPVKQDGCYLLANPGLSQMLRAKRVSMQSGKKVVFGRVDQKAEDLLFLKALIEEGKLKTIIDRCYPLGRTAEAHRYVETGQKAGHVIIAVEDDICV